MSSSVAIHALSAAVVNLLAGCADNCAFAALPAIGTDTCLLEQCLKPVSDPVVCGLLVRLAGEGDDVGGLHVLQFPAFH